MIYLFTMTRMITNLLFELFESLFYLFDFNQNFAYITFCSYLITNKPEKLPYFTLLFYRTLLHTRILFAL